MNFTAQIAMDNDAFAATPASELARLLRKAARQIEQDGSDAGYFMDSNGNKVGAWEVTS